MPGNLSERDVPHNQASLVSTLNSLFLSPLPPAALLTVLISSSPSSLPYGKIIVRPNTLLSVFLLQGKEDIIKKVEKIKLKERLEKGGEEQEMAIKLIAILRAENDGASFLGQIAQGNQLEVNHLKELTNKYLEDPVFESPPFALFSKTATGVQLNPQGINTLKSSSESNSCITISILGTRASGKSTLLASLFHKNSASHYLPTIKKTQNNNETAWCWVGKLPAGNKVVQIIVLEMPAISPTISSKSDLSIFALAVLLSNVLVFNCSRPVPDSSAAEDFMMASEMSKMIRISSQGANKFRDYFPHLIWAFRDFQFAIPQDKPNHTTTLSEYFVESLKSAAGDIFNPDMASIKKIVEMFPSIRAVGLPNPFEDAAAKLAFDSSSSPQSDLPSLLRSNFSEAVAALKHQLLTTDVGNRPNITAAGVATLLTEYEGMLSSATVPVVVSVLSSASLQTCEEAVESCVAEYTAEMEKTMGRSRELKPPAIPNDFSAYAKKTGEQLKNYPHILQPNQLLNTHTAVLAKVIENYKKVAFGEYEASKLTELKEIIGQNPESGLVANFIFTLSTEQKVRDLTISSVAMQTYMTEILTAAEKNSLSTSVNNAEIFKKEITQMCQGYLSPEFLNSDQFKNDLGFYANNIASIASEQGKISTNAKLQEDTQKKVQEINTIVQAARNQVNSINQQRNQLTTSLAQGLQAQVNQARTVYNNQVAANQNSINQLTQQVTTAEANRAQLVAQKQQQEALNQRKRLEAKAAQIKLQRVVPPPQRLIRKPPAPAPPPPPPKIFTLNSLKVEKAQLIRKPPPAPPKLPLKPHFLLAPLKRPAPPPPAPPKLKLKSRIT